MTAHTRPLRLVSLNANKRVQNARSRLLLSAWLAAKEPGVLLLQEPWPHSAAPSTTLGALKHIGGDSNVAAFVAEGTHVSLVRHQDRWLTLAMGALRLHNVYFPAESSGSARRAGFLDALTEELMADRGANHVVVGDFNLAPALTDGMYGGKPSAWTKGGERDAFDRLLANAGLVDPTSSTDSPQRFTFERSRQGKPLQFRCDLALLDRRLDDRGAATVVVDHSVRRGDSAFTDHSALIVDLTGPAVASPIPSAPPRPQ